MKLETKDEVIIRIRTALSLENPESIKHVGVADVMVLLGAYDELVATLADVKDLSERLNFLIRYVGPREHQLPSLPRAKGSPGLVQPVCNRHADPLTMVLRFYERPGSPPGNGWACPVCSPSFNYSGRSN